MATDAHDARFRRPIMTAAFELITQKLGKDTARLLCIENPKRVIEGNEIEQVSFVTKSTKSKSEG